MVTWRNEERDRVGVDPHPHSLKLHGSLDR